MPAELPPAQADGLFSKQKRLSEESMFDNATTKVLRAVLDEACSEVSRFDTSLRTHVASTLLECAQRGERSIEELQNVARQALRTATTMSR
jgi:hypothetical protein